MARRDCKFCRKPFAAKGKRLHCSARCAYQFKLNLRFARARARTVARGPVARTCVECGEQFETPRVGAGRGTVCCSDACRRRRLANRSADRHVRKQAARPARLCWICGKALPDRRGGRKQHRGECTAQANQLYGQLYRLTKRVERRRKQPRKDAMQTKQPQIPAVLPPSKSRRDSATPAT